VSENIKDIWATEYSPKSLCCLCGNHGVIDTRGAVFTPAKYDSGAKVFCICPNGRDLKEKFPDINEVPDYWVWIFAPPPQDPKAGRVDEEVTEAMRAAGNAEMAKDMQYVDVGKIYVAMRATLTAALHKEG
jgi:hypothetical protein